MATHKSGQRDRSKSAGGAGKGQYMGEKGPNPPEQGLVRPYLESKGLIREEWIYGNKTLLQRNINFLLVNAESWERVLEIVSEVLEWMDCINIATAMHRIATKTRWDHRAQQIAKASPTFSALLYRRDPREFNHRQLSNALWSVAAMDICKSDLLVSYLKRAEQLLSSTPDMFKSQELSNVLWSFATLSQGGALQFPMKVAELGAANIKSRDRRDFKPQTISNIIWSMAVAEHRDEELLATLARDAIPMLPQFNPQATGNTIWGYGALKFEHDELFRAACQASKSHMHTFKGQELSNMLLGFARCQFYNAAYMDNFDKTMAEMATSNSVSSVQVFANCLWACGTLRYFPTTCMTPVLVNVQARAGEMNPQELANTIWACARLGYFPGSGAMKALSISIEAQIDNFNLMGLCNVIWSFAVLRCTRAPVLRKILLSIIERFQDEQEDLVDEQGHQVFAALMVSREEARRTGQRDSFHGIEFPKEVHQKVLQAWQETAKAVTISSFQEEIHFTLESMGWVYHSEFNVDGLFSVDVALEGCSSSHVALEADGPHHFINNTRQPTGPSLLRRRLLKALGWNVVSVPYYEWARLKSQDEKMCYILRILSDAGIEAPVSLTAPWQGTEMSKAMAGKIPRRVRRGQTISLQAHRSVDHQSFDPKAEPYAADQLSGPAASWRRRSKLAPVSDSLPTKRSLESESADPVHLSESSGTLGSAASSTIDGSVGVEGREETLMSLTVQRGLKPLLKRYGLPVSGNKKELVQRILQHELDCT